MSVVIFTVLQHNLYDTFKCEPLWMYERFENHSNSQAKQLVTQGAFLHLKYNKV